MDKSHKEQTALVEKFIVQLRKETGIPKPVLSSVEKFFNYIYSISYYRGFIEERITSRNIAVFNNSGNLLEICRSLKSASEYSGVKETTIKNNIYGTKTRSPYEFRYTKREPTILK